MEADYQCISTKCEEPDKILQQLETMGAKDVLECWMCSLMLESGPKVMQPNMEVCRVVTETPINVTCGEYRQPFPVFLIELPDEFRKEVGSRNGVECPRIIKILHDERVGCVTVVWHTQGEHNMAVCDMDTMDYDSIEERIQEMECGKPHVARVLRVALNLSLLLTQYGVRVEGPLAAKTLERQKKKNAESKSPRRRTRAQIQLRRSLDLITFEQDVVFKGWSESTENATAGEGSPKSPHWRRGHFKRVRIGLGRRETKRIFIPSTFVNGGQFEGNVSDTSYRLRIEEDVFGGPED